MSPEEYDRLCKQIGHGVDGAEERLQREQIIRDFENGIFFIEDKREKNSDANEQ
jgi:hypothetical protein